MKYLIYKPYRSWCYSELFQLHFWVQETQNNPETMELTDLDSNVSERVWRNE